MHLEGLEVAGWGEYDPQRITVFEMLGFPRHPNLHFDELPVESLAGSTLEIQGGDYAAGAIAKRIFCMALASI